MKYSNEIVINLPRKSVLELFESVENLYKWQENLLSFEHVSGISGEVGAKSRLRYKDGNREYSLIETITVKNLPEEFSGTYETKNVWNEVKNYFMEIGDNSTKWTSECEFRFSGIMKFLSILFSNAFKNESMKFLVNFKKFAENTN